MACLATWKEGSSRYFVSMLNHSHVYTDETRYRCFVYQRQHSNELGRVTYKMAQSLYASCLGLWNVNEGHKTFTMTKCKLFFSFFCFVSLFFLTIRIFPNLPFSEKLGVFGIWIGFILGNFKQYFLSCYSHLLIWQ